MDISPGSKFGPFEVIALLGAGGMGDVYRARDTRLARMVALKFLRSTIAENSELLHRFHQEARAASALSHKNIVTIYELGNDGPSHYIAMELVEGTTLRDLLGSGILPMRTSLEIAVQVAEGLTKAHEAGITHRDLKPENLMVTQDGLVKILDFGLAKVGQSNFVENSSAETLVSNTACGTILGTFGYMSPEQAVGQRIDFRSDQFSFGALLYEMVTGKRAFQRATAAETIVAILREQVEPIALRNPEAPAPLCWVIERCLAKDPDHRYVSTRDLARELAAIRDGFGEKPSRHVEAASANLPVSRTVFVGREKEAASARELLLRPDVRLLTVTGPGGIGKTRLAVEVVSGLSQHFPGGIHFVPLAQLNQPALIASAIVQSLGIREVGGLPPLELLKKTLQDPLSAPMLILLDNFEHLVQAAAIVTDLLAIGPKLKILVTSRAPLHLYGEREFPVPPLALPDSRFKSSVDTLSQFPAVALFVQRATAAKPGFELNAGNASAVCEICARLDGLPLAIELAAARVKVLSPSSLLTRLASRLQLLTGGARDLPERQQTLRAAMDWSYDLLNPAEQKLLRRLSVFVGGCNLEGVEAVCDAKADLDLDLLDGMASMVDKSLVQQVEQKSGESRFVMLETVREYALEKLQSSKEESLTLRAHAAYFLVLAEEVATEQDNSDGNEWVARFDLEQNNFRAALEWLTETGEVDWGLRLGTALFRFWELREHFAEGRVSLGRLLNLPAASAPTRARNRALFAAGVLSGEQGDYAEAGRLISESQVIARQLGDHTGVAVSLNALAVLASDRGDLALAHSLFDQSLALWRESGDLKAVARSISNLANVVKLQGDYHRASTLYSECLSIFRGLRDTTGVAWSLNYQGDVLRQQGDSAAAQSRYQQCLAMFRETGDRWGIAGTLADLGNLASEQGDFSGAHHLYQESITVFLQLDHKRGIARLLECFASSAAANSMPERALRLAGAAAALRQNIGAPLTPAEQSKLEKGLNLARQSISVAVGSAAWLEGWALPIEKAVEEAVAADQQLPQR